MKKICSPSLKSLESEWASRNVHVLEVQKDARDIVAVRVANGIPKADLLLLAELMIDLVKRFD
jgi:hypothetical protein